MDGCRKHHIEGGNQTQKDKYMHSLMSGHKAKKTQPIIHKPENLDNKEDPKRATHRSNGHGEQEKTTPE